MDEQPTQDQNGSMTTGQRVLLAIIAAAVLVLLFTTVFPWVEQQLADPTLG